MKEKIKKILDENIKPSLNADGGDIEFVAWNEVDGILSVRMMGACVGCPMMQVTLKEGVEKTLKEKIPEVKEVINVVE